MPISRIQLAGLAVLLGGAATEAAAQTTINTPVTDPRLTSVTGELLVDTAGTITIDAGEDAVTMDSDDDIEIQGTLTSTINQSNVTGINITGNRTGNIEMSGTISFQEDTLRPDSDNDGDPDGPWATGTNRHGIFLEAGGSFTGNIIGDGVINIEGNNSSGITLNSLLTGNVDWTGVITLTGDNNVGMAINGGLGNGVDGDLLARGSTTVRGENAIGLLVDAPVTGELRMNGSWTVSGYTFLARPNDTIIGNLDADDLLESGPAVAIRYSVDGGVYFEGIGVENDEDDDGDGETDEEGDADDNRTTVIDSYGPGAAVLIQADASANLELGASLAPGEYGFVNRGGIRADGVYDNIEAYAVRVEGLGGRTATIHGGFQNDGTINAVSYEANAYVFYAGDGSIIDEILNRKTMNSLVTTDGTDTAYGIYINPNGSVGTITNLGAIRTAAIGDTGNAYAIYDAAGTVTQITNRGTISAITAGTTIVPTGDVVAIDLSNALAGVTIDQLPDVPFTDDDTVDNDEVLRPDVIISGDVRLGDFSDTINLMAGAIVGEITFGNGADVFNIDDGAIYSGVITDSDSDLTFNVGEGTLELTGGTVGITNAQFGNESRLVVHLGTGSPVTINASGLVNFDAGAIITPIVPVGLPASGSHTFLTAGTLNVGAGVTGPLTGDGVSWLYNISINEVGETLEAEYIRKTSTQLGLNIAQSAAFNPILQAMQLDINAAAALASLDNEADFFDAYEDLMPNYAGGATEMAAMAVQQMQSATTNRLATTRLRNLNEVSIWGQEIAYGLNREPSGNQGVDFRGQGFGFAGGIDGPLDNGGLFGLSISMLATEVEEPGRPEGEISSTFGQFNAYLGTASGPFDLDFVAGAGAGRMSSRRFVQIGTLFSANSEADWWAFEGHGAARASMPLQMGDWLVFTPQAALTYVALQEQGYTEEGGGPAIDYEVDETFSQRLWADVGFELSGRLALGGRDSFIAPRLYIGYRANALDEAAERTVRFVSTGTQFTVADDALGQGGPLIGLGVDATNGHSTFSLAYEGEFGDQIERHSLNAAIRFRF